MKNAEKYKIRILSEDEGILEGIYLVDRVSMWIDDPENNDIMRGVSTFYDEYEDFVDEVKVVDDGLEYFMISMDKDAKKGVERLIYEAFFHYYDEYKSRDPEISDAQSTKGDYLNIIKSVKEFIQLNKKGYILPAVGTIGYKDLVNDLEDSYGNKYSSDDECLSQFLADLKMAPSIILNWAEYSSKQFKNHPKRVLNVYQEELVKDLLRIFFTIEGNHPILPQKQNPKIDDVTSKSYNIKRYKFIMDALSIAGFRNGANRVKDIADLRSDLNFKAVQDIYNELQEKMKSGDLKKKKPGDLKKKLDEPYAPNQQLLNALARRCFEVVIIGDEL